MNSARYGDINSNFVNVLNQKEVIHIDNGKNDIYKSSLTVEGGAVIKKGLKIGYQEGMVSGLMIYDNENFYGYSDKYGLVLLSKHNDYTELEIDYQFFQTADVQKIAPIQTNASRDMVNLQTTLEEGRIVPLKLDIEIKDLTKYYITIPDIYSSKKFNLMLELELSIHNECLISDFLIVVVNESSRPVNHKFINNNCFYQSGYDKVINGKNIAKIHVEVVDKKYYLVTKQAYQT